MSRACYAAALAVALLIATAASAQAVELKPAANTAFDRYAELTEQRLDSEVQHGQFLWVDGLPADQRAAQYARLKHGEIVEEKLETRDGGKPIEAPGALIHDWVGIVFIPGATLAQTRAFMQDYENHPRFYKPDEPVAKILSHRGDDFQIYLRWYKHKVVSVTLNTYHDVHYRQLDPTHMISKSWTTKVAEVEDPDTPKEHELPVGHDRGFLWRTNSYWHTVEKDGGVYVQCEAITLTRDIPWALKWLASFINSASREFLFNLMGNVRTGVQARSGSK